MLSFNFKPISILPQMKTCHLISISTKRKMWNDPSMPIMQMNGMKKKYRIDAVSPKKIQNKKV